jgi:hypothetical protein
LLFRISYTKKPIVLGIPLAAVTNAAKKGSVIAEE